MIDVDLGMIGEYFDYRFGDLKNAIVRKRMKLALLQENEKDSVDDLDESDGENVVQAGSTTTKVMFLNICNFNL